MVVEVVPRQVQEDRHVEGAAGEPLEPEGVRGALEGRRRAAPLDERREHRLELRRLGCRPRGVERPGRPFSPAVDEGPEEAALRMRAAQDLVDEKRRGRLAARPGHSRHHEPAARVPGEARGEEPRGQPGVLDLEVRHLDPVRRGSGAERRRGARQDGLGDERPSVELLPREGGEEDAGAGAARVVRDAPHLRVTRRPRLPVREPLGERGELHGSSASVGKASGSARSETSFTGGSNERVRRTTLPRRSAVPGAGSWPTTKP